MARGTPAHFLKIFFPTLTMSSFFGSCPLNTFTNKDQDSSKGRPCKTYAGILLVALATFSARVVTIILLPFAPPIKSFCKSYHLLGSSSQISSKTSKYFLPSIFSLS
uniref:Uncharacterized protein n=1 Tax=Rhizophora mucronata TaxID=61149 RepID=A0A2P2JE98_RHIMU